MASSSCSSAILSPKEKRYDVFLSFRGEDVRHQFASYLYAALYDKKILTFMDHKLERGDEVSPTLCEAIKESMVSVVIFSENYATSTWCLDELVHILECKETNGQIVIPIFYNIDPSIVRKQEGSYGVAFARLEERFKDRMEMVHQWRAALKEAANLSGLDSRNFRPENKLIKKIVEDILLKLSKYSSWNIKHCNGRLFAIQERMEEIEKLLDIFSMDVRIVGIWGMGGIGKTTLASAVFQRFSCSHFEGRTYLWNVRQEYESFGPNYLRKKLLADLLKDEANIVSMDTPFVASPIILDRLRRKKVLIILDDVDSSIQLETLIEGYHQLAPGSRIIVTSRNKQVLVKVADEIHKVEGLNDIESLKLFHLHAFGKNSLATDYEILSKAVVRYANGNPLALKVLGSFLHSKSKEEWESALEKLKRVPNKDILKVLRISYEGLDDKTIRNLFLDIACFLDHPFTREYAESILGGGDSYPNIGISTLIDNSLIEIYREEETMLCMHDLIRQMGWSIVSDEHNEPGNRSRLFDAKDVCQVLEQNTGTEAIEGIVFNMSQIKREVRLSRTTFSRMHNLRVLKIICDNIDGNKCKLYLPRGLESLVSHELRCFHWDLYPLKSLPSDFTPENLVELILRHSHLKQLGNHIVQSLPKLKIMDLSNSKLLTVIADLSRTPNLESLNLEGCISLFQILSSIQNLHKLTYLNLSGCTNLRDLQEISGLRGYLDLVKRGDIKNLLNNVCQLNFPLYSSSSSISPKFPMNLTSLRLGGTTIEVLPSSIWCLPSLVLLDLHDCTKLKSVPTSICKLKSLETIFLDGCSNLQEFPEILETMESLNFIDMSGAAIKKLPESIENLIGLTQLRLDKCKDIVFLPNTLCNLSRLVSMELDNCSKLQTLPPCPLDLQFLSLKNCGSLKLITELPSSIDELDASYCTSLESISSWTPPLLNKMDNFDSLGRGRLKLTNCSKFHCNTGNSFLADGAAFVMMFREMLSKHVVIETETDDDVEFVYGCYPGDEIPKQFSFQSCGESLDVKLPPHWNSEDLLGVIFCVVLEPIKIDPDISCMICYQINDGDDYMCNRTVQIGKLEHNSDHVFTWFNTKQVNGRNWLSTYSNVTDVYFDVFSFVCHGESIYASMVGEYYMIKKCGIRFVYMNDLEQFAPSIDNDEYSKASGKGVVRFHDEEKDPDHGESHSTSILCKRRFDDGKQEDDDDDDDESQPMIDTKKIKLA